MSIRAILLYLISMVFSCVVSLQGSLYRMTQGTSYPPAEWSDPPNWHQNQVPVSDPEARIYFEQPGTVRAYQDIASPFVLNYMDAGPGPRIIQGSGLEFRENLAGKVPRIFSAGPGMRFEVPVTVNEQLVVQGGAENEIHFTGGFYGTGDLILEAPTKFRIQAIRDFTGRVFLNDGVDFTFSQEEGFRQATLFINASEADITPRFMEEAFIGGLGGPGGWDTGELRLHIGASHDSVFEGNLSAPGLSKIGSGKWTVSGTVDVADELSVEDGVLRVPGGSLSSASGTIGAEGKDPFVEIVGDGAIWEATEEFLIASSGSGNLNLEGGGRVLAPVIRAAPSANTTASIRLQDGETSLEAEQLLEVGGSGSAELEIVRGGTVKAPTIWAGSDFTGKGQVSLLDGESTHLKADEFVLGVEGEGRLQVTSFTDVETTDAVLGLFSTGSGHAEVAGTQGRWLNTGYLTIGEVGWGELAVRDAGTVQAPHLIAGFYEESEGWVTVENSGHLEVNNTAVLGWNGLGVLEVQEGGSLTMGKVILGLSREGKGVLRMDGEDSGGSVGSILAGERGEAEIEVAGGAMLNSGHGMLALDRNATASVSIRDPESVWRNYGMMGIGMAGTATVVVEDGGRMETTGARLGVLPEGYGNIRVRDTGSTFSAGRNFHVGVTGDAAVTVEDGASLGSVDAILGVESGSHGIVRLSGNGSRWWNNTDIRVGGDGVGEIHVEDGGSLVTDTFTLGREETGTGIVKVRGDQAHVDVENLVLGSGGLGQINVEDGGTLETRVAEIGLNTEGTVSVRGGGAIWKSALISIGDEGLASVNDGGEVETLELFLDSAVGGMPRFEVSDAESVLSASLVRIGSSQNGSLRGFKGGLILSDNAIIGEESGSEGEVILEGKNTLWEIEDDFVLGEGGTGRLEVRDGAQLVVARSPLPGSHFQRAYMARNPGSRSEMIIDGSGSRVHLERGLLVGGRNLTGGGGYGNIVVRNGGFLDVEGGLIFYHGRLVLDGGIFRGATDPSKIDWIRGTVITRASFLLTPGVEFVLGEAQELYVTNDVLFVEEDATFILQPGAVFEAEGVSIRRGTIRIEGETMLTKSGAYNGGEMVLVDGVFVGPMNNVGTLISHGISRHRSSANEGDEFLQQGEVTVHDGALHFEIPVRGSGSYSGSGAVVFEADFLPDDSVRIPFEGDVRFGPDSRLVIPISDTTPNQGHPVLAIDGSMTAGGSLVIEFIDNYAGRPGDSFTIFESPAISGEFSEVNLPSLPSGLLWDTSRLYDRGQLRIIGDVDSYEDWRSLHFSVEDLGNESVSGALVDPTGGQFPNLMRYALGAAPFESNEDVRPRLERQRVFVNGHAKDLVTLSFERLKLAADVELRIESSVDMDRWEEMRNLVVLNRTDHGAIETVTVGTPLDGHDGDRFFLRLRAVPVNPEVSGEMN